MDIKAILAAVLRGLAIAFQILGFVQNAAQETAPLILQQIAAAAANTVNSPTWGNHALLTKLQAVQDDLDASVASLTLQIVHLTDGTTPISLPVAPPAGYGYVGDSAIFNAVWNGLNSPDVETPYQYLRPVGTAQMFHDGFAAVYPADPYWSYFFTGYNEFGVSGTYYPVFDTSLILEGDDLLTYVQRVNPTGTAGWFGGVGGYVEIDGSTGDGTCRFLSRINDPQFRAIRDQLWQPALNAHPPVWPGLALVTLAAPISMSTGLTITTPMDGVIVNLTGEPAKSGFFTFDDVLSYRNLGALSFYDDDGHQEPPQSLGFTDAIYCPKTMVRAAGVKLRAVGGVTGTITPWVVGP